MRWRRFQPLDKILLQDARAQAPAQLPNFRLVTVLRLLVGYVALVGRVQ